MHVAARRYLVRLLPYARYLRAAHENLTIAADGPAVTCDSPMYFYFSPHAHKLVPFHLLVRDSICSRGTPDFSIILPAHTLFLFVVHPDMGSLGIPFALPPLSEEKEEESAAAASALRSLGSSEDDSETPTSSPEHAASGAAAASRAGASPSPGVKSTRTRYVAAVAVLNDCV